MANILLTSVGNDGAQAIIKALRISEGNNDIDTLIGIDSNPHAYGLYMTDYSYIVSHRSNATSLLEELHHIINVHHINLVLPLSTEDQSFYAHYAYKIEQWGCKVQHSPEKSITIANNKHLLLPFLQKHGLEVPYFRIAHNCTELENLLYEFDAKHNPIVIKRAFSTGACGVKIVIPSTDTLERMFDRTNIYISIDELLFWMDKINDTMPILQISEFLPDAKYSVDVFLHNGKAIEACVRTEEKRIYGTSLYGVTLEDKELYEIGLQAASSLLLEGTVNIELGKDRNKKTKIIEINPRFPASIDHTITAGCNMPRWVVQAALGKPFKVNKPCYNVPYFRHWTFLSNKTIPLKICRK